MERSRPSRSFPYDGTIPDLFTGEPRLPPDPPKRKRKERPKKEKPDTATLPLDLDT